MPALPMQLEKTRTELARERNLRKGGVLKLRQRVAQADAARQQMQGRLDAALVAEKQLRDEAAMLRRAKVERDSAKDQVEMQV